MFSSNISFNSQFVVMSSFQIDSELLRENLERIVGSDDSAFSGIDLATLIRNKYGRSYDVQLIKKVCYINFCKMSVLYCNRMYKS